MDDTSRDLFLSPESLECHPPQWTVDGEVFIPLSFIPKFPVGQTDLLRSLAATSSDWWSLSLAFLSPFL
jgi:hypothetical protein